MIIETNFYSMRIIEIGVDWKTQLAIKKEEWKKIQMNQILTEKYTEDELCVQAENLFLTESATIDFKGSIQTCLIFIYIPSCTYMRKYRNENLDVFILALKAYEFNLIFLVSKIPCFISKLI